MTAIYIEIAATRGSTPRDAGTAMKVTAQAMMGTIGGGALEHHAVAHARAMLREGRAQDTQTVPLGPGLGQCCGGSVTLRYTRDARPVETPPAAAAPMQPATQAPALWLWGAGHVGRAVVAACPADAAHVTWIDSSRARFPDTPRAGVAVLPVHDMPRLAKRAPVQAHHLIFTYAHDIDLALCAALLRRGFASCGVIGSATKWTRFQARLRAAGLDPAPITCPIGNRSRGKHPTEIAAGAVAALRTMEKTPA